MASTLRTRWEVAADSWGGPSGGGAALVVVDAAGWTSARAEPGCDEPGCDEPAWDEPACDEPACDQTGCGGRGREWRGASASSLIAPHLLRRPVGGPAADDGTAAGRVARP
jgi:hypothetical protein